MRSTGTKCRCENSGATERAYYQGKLLCGSACWPPPYGDDTETTSRSMNEDGVTFLIYWFLTWIVQRPYFGVIQWVTPLCSDTSMFRHLYVPTNEPMFRHPYPPTPVCSDTPIFRHPYMFRHPFKIVCFHTMWVGK